MILFQFFPNCWKSQRYHLLNVKFKYWKSYWEFLILWGQKSHVRVVHYSTLPKHWWRQWGWQAQDCSFVGSLQRTEAVSQGKPSHQAALTRSADAAPTSPSKHLNFSALLRKAGITSGLWWELGRVSHIEGSLQCPELSQLTKSGYYYLLGI